MRKIQTQADINKEKKKNQIIIGVVMILLLVVAPLGYSLISGSNVRDDDSEVSEFGYDFFRDGGVWKTVIGGDVFWFQNLPSEVLDVDVNVSMEIGQYSGRPLYFVNPNRGMNEVLNNIGRYVLRYQESCLRQDSSVVGGRWSVVGNDLGNFSTDDESVEDLNNSSVGNESEFVCEGDFPIKDCGSNLIIFVEGNETMVYQNESCVYIVGDGVKGADAFLYDVLEVTR